MDVPEFFCRVTTYEDLGRVSLEKIKALFPDLLDDIIERVIKPIILEMTLYSLKKGDQELEQALGNKMVPRQFRGEFKKEMVKKWLEELELEQWPKKLERGELGEEQVEWLEKMIWLHLMAEQHIMQKKGVKFFEGEEILVAIQWMSRLLFLITNKRFLFLKYGLLSISQCDVLLANDEFVLKRLFDLSFASRPYAFEVFLTNRRIILIRISEGGRMDFVEHGLDPDEEFTQSCRPDPDKYQFLLLTNKKLIYFLDKMGLDSKVFNLHDISSIKIERKRGLSKLLSLHPSQLTIETVSEKIKLDIADNYAFLRSVALVFEVTKDKKAVEPLILAFIQEILPHKGEVTLKNIQAMKESESLWVRETADLMYRLLVMLKEDESLWVREIAKMLLEKIETKKS